MEKTKEAFSNLADNWHNFRCAVAETLIVWAWMLMPAGAEKDRMNAALYEYHLWLKDND